MYKIPFKTPVDYWITVLKKNKNKIDIINELLNGNYPDWLLKYDCDLHIYPYVKAIPSLLSVGCNNKCDFCPTAKEHKGNITFGNPKRIIPKLENKTVHFMDENFFQNDMNTILPLLQKYKVKWLAMTHYKDYLNILNQYNEDYLFKCGLRIVEMGLENVALMRKVSKPIKNNLIEIYYLNMTFLPNETKETIKENAKFMKPISLKRPIHFNNSLWYAPGQFYFPYDLQYKDGIILKTEKARVCPTYIPNSFLNQDMEIINMELINYYNQLVYDYKLFPEKTNYNIRDFIGNNYKKAQWLVVGLRTGGII